MFGIGFLELCVILVGGLILFGPQKAPELMQKIGKFLFHLRKLSNELQSSVQDAMETKPQPTDVVLPDVVLQKKSERNSLITKLFFHLSF